MNWLGMSVPSPSPLSQDAISGKMTRVLEEVLLVCGGIPNLTFICHYGTMKGRGQHHLQLWKWIFPFFAQFFVTIKFDWMRLST